MLGFKVLNIKNILKILIIFILIIFIKLLIDKVQAPEEYNIIEQTITKVPVSVLKSAISNAFPGAKLLNDYVEHEKIHLSVKSILKYEMGSLSKILEEESLKIDEKDLTNDDKEEIILKYSEVNPEVKENGMEEKYSTQFNNVKIKNVSDYEITEEMLNLEDDYVYSRNILLYHTHTCESYTSEAGFEYESTGNYRTTDLNYSVVRIGNELEKNLKSLKFNVIHDKTYHDFPSYSGSYTRSYSTIKEILNKNSKYDIVFDIHRDAVGSSAEYVPVVKIDEEEVAQLMFVIGTDGGGLEHPEWKNNLKFAVKIQKKADELYPGLFRPIMVSNSRFNQNLARGACIIEVGATGNTLKQAINSMKYLSIILDNVI